MSAVPVTKKPARTSSVLAVAFATIALVLSSDSAATRVPIAVEIVGLVVAGAGSAASARGHRTAGRPVVVVGAALALASIPVAVLTIEGEGLVVALVPGLVGVFALTMGLLPVRGNGSRLLVRSGAALVFLSVLAAAVFRLTPMGGLLAAAVSTILAWDVGDNAIGLGEQLGTSATTRRPEVVHLVGSGVVGVVGVGAAVAVGGVSVPGASLEAFVLLLVAVLLLTLSLHG